MFCGHAEGAAFALLGEQTVRSLQPSAARATTVRGLAFTSYGVTKSFSMKPVLRGLNVVAKPGEFLAIVGRSGCGKSTFLRLLAGFDQPDYGLIVFDSDGRARQASDVRVMFQEPRLLPWQNVLENVIVGLGEGIPRQEARGRAGAALAAVGLADRADEWPAVLSGGQKQRVALARALVSGAGILALDEPLGALDALTRIEMQRLLERLWLEQGFTAIMVTHDVAEAITLADRVVLIEDGIVTLDRAVDLPRPRQRGTSAFAALEGEILERLLTDQTG